MPSQEFAKGHKSCEILSDLTRSEAQLLKYFSLFCVVICAMSAQGADSGDVASQCSVGRVKLTWKPVKRCIVFENDAKFKATLDAWGWATQPVPVVNWSKEAVILDSGNNPYGNGVASCSGVRTDESKKKLTLTWGWKQVITPSASTRSKGESRTAESDSKDKTIGDKAKESVSNAVTDAKQAVNNIVEDAKKFPSPIPKRAAIIAVVPKEFLSAKSIVDCVVEK